MLGVGLSIAHRAARRLSAVVTATSNLLLSGDEQSGTDQLSLSGDQQSGSDALKLSGDEQ